MDWKDRKVSQLTAAVEFIRREMQGNAAGLHTL